MGISLSIFSQPEWGVACAEDTSATIEDVEIVAKADFSTYKKRSGTADLGKDYEYMMCALYALKFAINDDIVDFKMTTNNDKYGDFDDISLEVTFRDKTTKIFLLQLKHKENKKNLTTRDLANPKGDFSLVKYLTSFENLKCDTDNVVCVLYTNCRTKIEKSATNTDGLQFRVKGCSPSCHTKILANPLLDCNIFQFEIEQNVEFSQKFYFFSGQDGVGAVKTSVRRILDEVLKQDLFDSFISYMRNWWSGRFVLTKHDVVAKLVELALAPWTKTLSGSKLNHKSELLAKTIMDFDLTIVGNGGDDIVENIWDVEKHNMFDIASKKYDSREESKILWFLGTVPLVVATSSENVVQVTCAVELSQRCSKKIVLIGNLNREVLPKKLKIFQNLADLSTDETIHNFKISLQQRQPISLKQLIECDPGISEIVSTAELLHMSQNEYLVVGSQPDEKLPEAYIPRTISTLFLNTREVVEYCKYLTNCALIINCDESFKTNSYLFKVKVKHLDEFQDKNLNNLVLLSINSRCNISKFQEIAQDYKNVYLIETLDDNYSTLLLTKGFSLPLKEGGEFAPKKHISCKRVSLKESHIFTYFDYCLNVFCAPPGMGKSTLLQILSGRYCPKDCWSLHVNLISHNAFLRRRPGDEEMLKVFGDGEESKIRDRLVEKNKVHLFLDGLDELDSEVMDHVLVFAKSISDKGIHVWISSRENLQPKISKTLNKIPIEINEVNKEEQICYIHNRLGDIYEEEEIETIIDVVSTSSDVANSQQLLGIPLQLYIITEMFRNSKETYDNLNRKKIFVLTNMYKVFFEGKKNFCFRKIGIDGYEYQLGLNFEHHLKQYEVLGLKSCLDSTDFDQFQLERTDFENQIQKLGDKFGIIKTINDDGQLIFTHQTYAEYFACVWLRSHLDKVHLLQERLFSQRYENLKLMFDVMMAENNPLHLAIIYKNMEQFEQHLIDSDKRDDGGRTALHLACSYGKKYPEDFTPRVRLYRELEGYREVLDVLVKKETNVLNTDQIFGFTCLDYAVRARCLYPLEKILEKEESTPLLKLLKRNFQTDSLGFYSAQLGYPHLLSLVLGHSSVKVNSRIFGNFSLLGVATVGSEDEEYDPPRQGNLDVVRTLIKNGADINAIVIPDYAEKGNILDYASREGCYDVVKVLSLDYGLRCIEGNNVLHRIAKHGVLNKTEIHLLTELNIDINSQNDNGQSPLQICAKECKEENVKKLLEIGAYVNSVDIDRNTALHYSLQTRIDNIETIKLLTNNSIDVDAQNVYGKTALHVACEYGNEENVLQLLKSGASVNIVDHDGNSPLHAAVKLWSDDVNIIDSLLTYKADVNARNKKGTTPLHTACGKGQVKNLGKLLKFGARLDIVDNEGNSALHYACQMWSNNVEVIYALVFFGVGVNVRNKRGQTPLHIACRVCNIDNVEELVEVGADVSIVDADGRNALHYARKSRWYQKPEAVNLLISLGLEVVVE